MNEKMMTCENCSNHLAIIEMVCENGFSPLKYKMGWFYCKERNVVDKNKGKCIMFNDKSKQGVLL
jgi:hypothetical protein